MEEMNFRYAKIEDAKMLAEVGAETFWDAYHEESTLEMRYLKSYIAKTFTEEILRKEIKGDEITYLR